MDKKIKILIVDDDNPTREMYAEVFQNANFEVMEARDGVEGLDLATKNIHDIIFTGIIMPRMDGWGVIREMRSNPEYASIPIMILSTVIEDASHRRYELETGLAMDIQGYIQKPAKPEYVINKINRILQKQTL